MIRSTIPAIYTLRSKEEAIIEIAITDWRYEPIYERYVATVEDYALIGESKQMCNRKEVHYTNEQIDGLFSMMQNPIYPNESYSGELIKLIAGALLYVTQTDLYENGKTIYGLLPENWEINADYAKTISKK